MGYGKVFSPIVAVMAVALGFFASAYFRGNSPFAQIRKIPDVVIEKEAFRRFGLLHADTCTYCRESWKSCHCEMKDNPLMFQNREKQTPEKIESELAKYGVRE